MCLLQAIKFWLYWSTEIERNGEIYTGNGKLKLRSTYNTKLYQFIGQNDDEFFPAKICYSFDILSNNSLLTY